MFPIYDLTFHRYEVSLNNGSTVNEFVFFVKKINRISDSFVNFNFFHYYESGVQFINLDHYGILKVK